MDSCIQPRSYTMHLPIMQEMHFVDQKNYLFDLHYLGSMEVIGEQAKTFLQGQLSCEVRDVNTQQMRQGALCNLKGRILALLDVLEWQGLRIILPKDLIETTYSSLAQAALFSKVTLKPCENYRFFGLYLQNLQDVLPQNLALPLQTLEVVSTLSMSCYNLGDNFYILAFPTHEASSLVQDFSQHEQYRGSMAWHALQLQRGRIEIYPESRGLFLPHDVGVQKAGYINFNKGCYKGQEIIARMHYRGKLKYQLQLITRQNEDIYIGKKLLSEDTQSEIGEIIDFSPNSKNTLLIAASMLTKN